MLTLLTNERRKRRFLVYDLEWYPGTLELRIVGTYDGSRYRCYRTVEAFLENALTSENRGCWFYAHAGGLADVQFVLEKLADRSEYSVRASFSGSSAIIVHVRRGKNSWHFVDSLWLLKTGLKDIGKWIGMEKGAEGPYRCERCEGYHRPCDICRAASKHTDCKTKGCQDCEVFNKHSCIYTKHVFWADLTSLIRYNEKDCIILWTAIAQFEEALYSIGGELKMTLASCSMNLFRRAFLSNEIETSEDTNETARQSYVASRVEVYNTFCDNANYYDVNSSFPYAMTFPCPGNLIKSSRRIPSAGIYLADVEIEVAEGYLTPLAIKQEGRIFFPMGRWRAWLTSIDVELLQQEGGKILHVYEVLHFEEFYDLRDFANTLYDKRNAGKTEFEKIVYKYLLNSLYGKFAESAEKQTMLLNPEIRPRLKEEGGDADMLFPGCFLRDIVVPVNHAHVPISSHITAIARRTLYYYISNCNDVYYCDTDGFATTEFLETGTGLGALKLEKIIDFGHFISPKVYRLHTIDGKDILKAKGFSLKRDKEKEFSRFMQLVEGEEIEIDRMARIKELYRKGLKKPFEWSQLSKLGPVKKKLQNLKVKKRFTYPDGATRPWHIDEIRK